MRREFVSKSWGFEDIITNVPEVGYCGKRLVIYRGRKTSWHYHKVKDETLYVASGELMVHHHHEHQLAAVCRVHGLTEEQAINSGNFGWHQTVRPGEHFHIPPGMRHQLEALGDDAVVFEFSTTHREEDTVRVIPGGEA